MIEYLLNNAYLVAGVVTTFLIALTFITTARRAWVRDRDNFITIPQKRSCFDCDDHFVLPAGPGVAESALADKVQKQVLGCRAYMRDEMRLSGPALNEKWIWTCEEDPEDYQGIASKCPQFTLIQGGKK